MIEITWKLRKFGRDIEIETTHRLRKFGRDIEKVHDYCREIEEEPSVAGAQALYANVQLIFAGWRRDLPEHYKPIIDHHQEIVDKDIASRVEERLRKNRWMRVIGESAPVLYHPK